MFGFFRKRKAKRQRRFEGVYAGPDVMGKGTEPDGGAEFEEVYAGPDIYAGREEDDPSPGADDGSADTKPDPNQFACVYAGPDVMSGRLPPNGAAPRMDVAEAANGDEADKPEE